MEVALVQLKEKRGLLQKPIDAHRALISPMRLIPQDILLEIFLSCLPSKHNALMDPNEAPLLLGRICRHWRSVAYSAPMLWSSIHIPPLDHLSTPPNILTRLERFIGTWLERSATCSLSVSLFDFTNSYPILEENPLILELFAVSRRLRSLSLAGDADLMRPLLQLGPEDLPLLKRIRIRTLAGQTSSTNILQVPALEDVALCTTVIGDPLALPLPWSQLTNLRLDCYRRWTGQGVEGGLDFDAASTVLRKCPNLERCEIRITKPSEPLGLPSVDLPRLHTLIFTGWEFHFPKWSSDLVAPNLRALQIGDVLPDTELRTHASLRADIDPNRFVSSSLVELLQSFPAISHLRLSSDAYPPHPVALDNKFMALFCPPHNLCPMMAEIDLVAPSAGFSDAAALAFIKARMTMPTSLRRFQAQFCRPMEFDIMPELQSFISDGLRVDLKYAPATWRFGVRDGLDGPEAFY
ncbi:F-box domain-containing protein [Mycena sanguinolenta]|uniref:F-box domain-containing protein n=1 Tax=Mycena sanguinolenta TaxID=230812 RepID=A0A8H7CUB1_9AGAR|nr:F-box domain-containing protein [Mycena sanguinolenta]